ncbi:M67 family metallopeptidase [Cecembia calidifontis]|uniref:M67 family metallopeptidase n=1 Tax=Cecembia calidifontis TaxID=1187080 RepID=UPI0013EE524B|nr:M67 family metallopeptidase [Cecembia calidifontis]
MKRKSLCLILNQIEKVEEESCGILLGTHNSTIKKVECFIPTQNITKEDKKNRFEISSKSYLEAEKQAIELNLKILGIYHSHIEASANPSLIDQKNAFPEFSYLIISLRNQMFSDIKSWVLNKDQIFIQEELLLSNH